MKQRRARSVGSWSKTLEGSLTPLVAYLVDSKGLSDEEAQKLRDLLDL